MYTSFLEPLHQTMIAGFHPESLVWSGGWGLTVSHTVPLLIPFVFLGLVIKVASLDVRLYHLESKYQNLTLRRG